MKRAYTAVTQWTGNEGSGTNHYASYSRNHIISKTTKNVGSVIQGSSDPTFLGDEARYSPEELLVAALSACHMLWYLHLCADAGVVVIDYRDEANGVMVETTEGGGHFSTVTLNPVVTVEHERMIDKANELHDRAHKLCFIANSTNFVVHHNPRAIVSRLDAINE